LKKPTDKSFIRGILQSADFALANNLLPGQPATIFFPFFGDTGFKKLNISKFDVPFCQASTLIQ
jgi:hypothetical protein